MSRSEAIQLIDLLAISRSSSVSSASAPRHRAQRQPLAAAGMLAAIAATLWDEGVVSYWPIVGAIVVGSVIGVLSARAVQMTAMPQMVALFNGIGGGDGSTGFGRRVPVWRQRRAPTARDDPDRASL